MESIFRIDSISVLHELWGYDKPKHPLITLIEMSKIKDVKARKITQFVSGLYFISLKNKNCTIKYGHQYYDFDEGSLIFMAPEQVIFLAREMGYSTNYLSDLLKKETGKNTQEHIQLHLINKAKSLLLGTSVPIYEIAYMLGFDYPTHFSKFFKSKTGISPMDFRK